MFIWIGPIIKIGNITKCKFIFNIGQYSLLVYRLQNINIFRYQPYQCSLTFIRIMMFFAKRNWCDGHKILGLPIRFDLISFTAIIYLNHYHCFNFRIPQTFESSYSLAHTRTCLWTCFCHLSRMHRMQVARIQFCAPVSKSVGHETAWWLESSSVFSTLV